MNEKKTKKNKDFEINIKIKFYKNKKLNKNLQKLGKTDQRHKNWEKLINPAEFF